MHPDPDSPPADPAQPPVPGEDSAALFAQSPLGILQLDALGHLRAANPALRALLEPAGMTAEAFLWLPALRETLAAARVSGTASYEGTVSSGDWRAELRLTVCAHREGDGPARAYTCFVEDFSGSRRAERELLERNELLDAFFQQSLEGFYIATFDEPLRWDDTVDKEAAVEWALDHLRITQVNAALLAQYGMEESDILGIPNRSFHEHDLEQAKRDFRDLLDHGRRWVETCERRADGSTVWFEGNYVVLHDASGRHKGHFGIQRDITARKQWEESLRSNEERIRALFDAVNDAVFIHDPVTGAILQTNRRTEELYGYTEAELRALDVGALSSGEAPYTTAGAKTFLDRALAEGPQLFEWHAKDREGRLFWVEVSARRVSLTGESRVMVAARDITARKEAETQVRERDQLFRRLFDRSPDPNLLMDEHGFLDCNPATLAFFGAERREQVVGSHPWALSPPRQPDGRDSQEKAGAMIAQAYREGSHRFEWIHRRLDGTDLPAEVLLTTVPWQGRWILHIDLRDLSERHRAEAERRSLEAQVLQAQKLESLGVLAGGIAHDFNNLLTAILGNLNLAQGACAAGHDATRFLEAAERTVLKASDLTKQMLAYSGRGRFVVKRMDLNALVTEMGDLIAVSIPKKVVLHRHLAPGLPALEADAAQLQQVVLNLVTNAAEAIGDGEGRITLSTTLERLGADEARALTPSNDLPAGDYLVLEVADTGCGIEAETLDRIFDPFFTTKRAGRGLGLSSMLGILRAHRGGIRIRSRSGHGSSFRVYLPACDREVEPALEAARAPRAIFTGTILLVDDEPDILSTGEALLEAMGFRVLTARDGQEAVHLAAQHGEELDLVLMDLTMPRLDGREAFRAMQLQRPGLRILLSSGYDEQETLRELAWPGLAGFLQKPYRLQELRAALQTALGGMPPEPLAH